MPTKGTPAQMRRLGDTFRRIVDLLERERIGYVVIGALAVRAYIPARRSGDVDLMVAPGQVVDVVTLASPSFSVVRTRGDDVTVLRDRKNRIEVHLRSAVDKSDCEAIASVVAAELFGRRVRLPAPEYLVTMKLASMRGQRKHLDDILALLLADCVDVRFVVAHLVREHPMLVEVFAALVSQATPRR
jgi:hypothetical protein